MGNKMKSKKEIVGMLENILKQSDKLVSESCESSEIGVCELGYILAFHVEIQKQAQALKNKMNFRGD